MRQKLAFGLTLLVFLLLLPAAAFADHDESTVVFDKLAGLVDKGQLTLVYQIDRRSWRILRKKKAEAQLNLWLAPSGEGDAHFAYSQDLRTRKGSFTFPKSVALRNGDRVEIEVVGYEKAYRVEAVHFAGKTDAWVTFTVTDGKLALGVPDDHDDDGDHDDDDGDQDNDDGDDDDVVDKPPVDPQWRLKVIAACKEAVSSTKVDKCVAAATQLVPNWAAAAVAACDDAFSSTYVQKCLAAARGHVFEPAPTIKACDDAFGGYSYVLKCVDKARTFKTTPASAVAACDDAFGSYTHALTCMDETRSYISAPAPVVAACDEAASGYRAQHQCIQAARGLGDSAASLVKACDGPRVAACLQSATGR